MRSASCVRVMTLNLLAPCYRSVCVGQGGAVSESVLPRVWGSRLDRLADMVTEADVDLVCLQEVWFRAEFLEVLERRLGEFWMATARRTGGKEDGVATLWRKGISAIGAAEVDLQGGGDRVARLDLLQLGIRRVVLLVNVHLTFLHSNEEVPMRKMQVEQLIREIDRFISNKQLPQTIPVIIAGDFNGVDDGIGEMLGSAGFVSVAPKSIGMITHLTHLNTRICADFIWYRANGNKGSCQKKKFSSIRASTFALLPEGVEYTSWPADYVLSDHRPLIANFEFEDD